MKYGLIGEKLSHSYSKIIHEEFHNFNYELIEISKDKLCEFMEKRDFLGINVTIPYKQAVIPFLYFISEEAKKIGSVNTIVNKNGKLYGYNTDYFGFLCMVHSNNITFKDKNVLILGNGGTSLTANFVAADEGAKDIKIISRNGEFNYFNLYNFYNYDIIINTTPVGMYPNCQNSLLDLSTFSNLSAVIDVIYNPLKTKLILDAEKLNINNVCGLSMLVFQALAAHNYFFETNLDNSKGQKVLEKLIFKISNIVLIGMPGCGKSTVGKILAKSLNRTFIDIDEKISEKAGMKIPEIFEKYGEEYFRTLESEIIRKYSIEKSQIISTGGGAILKTENIDNLKQNGKIIFIQRDLEKLSTKNRPLSKNREEILKLYEHRYPIYLKSCDFKVELLEQPKICSKNIIKMLSFYTN